jgi:hypothetical protein
VGVFIFERNSGAQSRRQTFVDSDRRDRFRIARGIFD